MKEQLAMFPSVFSYAHWCEVNFEENYDLERVTTYTSDLSIAEWCGGASSVVETIDNATELCYSDYTYFTEMIVVLNMKCWEHHGRGNLVWSKFYAELYHTVKDFFFDVFSDDREASEYFFYRAD